MIDVVTIRSVTAPSTREAKMEQTAERLHTKTSNESPYLSEIKRLRKEIDDLRLLLRIVTHDVTGMQRGIMYNADVILSGTQDETIRDNAEHVRRLSEESVSIMKFIHGYIDGLSVRRTWFDAALAAESTARSVFASYGIDTSLLSVIFDDVHIYADEGLFKTVIRNMVSNSLKHGKNGVVPEVTIAFHDMVDRWMFCVIDNGVGLDNGRESVVFSPYKKLSKETGGSGLGLFVSKKIAQAHDGEIGYTSEPGKETIFWFTIKKPRSERLSPVK